MTRRCKIVIFAGCGLTAVALVCFFCFRNNEPSYKGRTLTEWLSIKFNSARRSDNFGHVSISDGEAERAVREIGARGVPVLMNLYQTGLNIGWLEQRITNLPRLRHSKWIDRFAKRQEAQRGRNLELAFIGFDILGTNGLSALPHLSAHFVGGKSGGEQVVAARMICFMGQPGFDYIVHQVATNQDTRQRVYASMGIYDADITGIDVNEAAAVLKNLTNASDPGLAMTARQTLEYIQSRRRLANGVVR